MRTLNRKLFLGLIVGAVLAAGALFGVHLFQYQRIAKALLWQANRAEEQGQVERVARYLLRYLEFAPRDLDARAKLGRTYASNYYAGDPRMKQKAVNLLDGVLTADPNRPELRRLLVKTALEVNNLKAGEDNLKVLVAATGLAGDGVPPKERGELEALTGRLLEAKGETAAAIGKYREAVRLAPEEQTSYVRLAYLLRRQPEEDAAERRKHDAEADRLIADLVEKNPTDYKPYLARWTYRRDFGLLKTNGNVDLKKLEEAAEDVAAARTRAPEEVDVLLAAADLARMQDKREDARKELERGLQLQDKKTTPAVDVVRFQLLWHLTNLLLDGKKDGEGPNAGRKFNEADRPEVERLIGQVRRTNASPASADYLEGRLHVAQGSWREAAVCFERARPLLTAPPELANQVDLQLGRCYEQLDETALMGDAFERAAGRDAGAVSARIGKARALAARDRVTEAIKEYEQAMAVEGAPDSGWLDLARLRIRQQLESGRTPDWTGVNEALDRVEASAIKAKDAKLQVEVILLRAELIAHPDQWDKAAAYLKTARDKTPDRAELWTAYAVILGKKKDGLGAALAVLDEAAKRLQDCVELRLARARLLAEGGYDKAKQALTDLEKGVNQFKEEDQARLLAGLAEIHFAAGNVAESRRLWEVLTRLPKYKDDLRAYLLLFDLAQKENAEAAMKSALERIRAAERGQAVYYPYGQALFLIWQAKKGQAKGRGKLLAEARAGLDQVEAVRRSWSATSMARAEIARLEGNTEQVVTHLRTAIEQGEKGPGAIGQLIEALSDLKRYDEANQETKRLREALFVDSDLGRAATGVALHTGELDRALRLASLAVPETTKDFRKVIWQAEVLIGANKLNEAEAHLRRAVQLAPEEPAPYLALVQFLASRSRGAEADLVIKEASAKLPAERRPLTLAQCYEALGHLEKARASYKEAVQAQPGEAAVLRAAGSFALRDGRLADALPLLRPLAEGKVKSASAADVEWGRQGLAVVLAAGTDYRGLREALDLVGVKLDGEGKLPPDTGAERDEPTDRLRARARVLATQPQPQFRDRAIALFDLLGRRRTLTPDDQFVLSQLYEAAGNFNEARSQLSELVSPQSKNPQYVAKLAQTLIRPPAADLDKAERLIKQLETLESENEVESGAYASVELRARLLEARKEGDQAVRLLRKYAERGNSPPMRKLLVIASLGRQGRFEDALPWCEKAWRDCPPEAVGGTCVALLRGIKKPTDGQLEQVERWLKDAIARNPKSMALLMHKADLLDMRGNYQEAEALYQVVLQNEPGNVVALNNLAWLLAQHKKEGQAAYPLINKAVNGLGRRPDLLDTRGLVNLALGQTDAALADFREATGDGTAADPAAAARLFHLARALYESKDRDGAARVLRQAREKGLQASNLHPIEQETCRKLLSDLNVK